MLGRGNDQHAGHSRAGYDFIHSAVDDRTRLAFSQILNDESGPTSAGFLLDAARAFAELGIHIDRVMTDEHGSYTRSRAFKSACQELCIEHITTGPYRPRINGKVERFHRTLVEEWAYRKLYTTNGQRRAAYYRWLRHYNHTRPHTALGGLSPLAFLNNADGNYS